MRVGCGDAGVEALECEGREILRAQELDQEAAALEALGRQRSERRAQPTAATLVCASFDDHRAPVGGQVARGASHARISLRSQPMSRSQPRV